MDGLAADLSAILSQLHQAQDRLASYEDLKTQLKLLTSQLQKQMKGKDAEEMETLMDLGCDMYVNAKVPDISRIFVNVGLDIHVEVTLEEADQIADRWIARLTQTIDNLAKERAIKKAQIRLVSEKLSLLSTVR